MVEGLVFNPKIAEQVRKIYDSIETEIAEYPEKVGRCDACGKCCDFAGFEHKLYVTTPEIISFLQNTDRSALKSMESDVCPFNQQGKCSVYKNRFAGCRIFSCKGDKDFQSDLTEKNLTELKAICNQYTLPYEYTDLKTAINKYFR